MKIILGWPNVMGGFNLESEGNCGISPLTAISTMSGTVTSVLTYSTAQLTVLAVSRHLCKSAVAEGPLARPTVSRHTRAAVVGKTWCGLSIRAGNLHQFDQP